LSYIVESERLPAARIAGGPVASEVTGTRAPAGTTARSLLLTVLGEFVYPRSAGVWTGTFLEALGALGVHEKAARQALTRTAAAGLIVSGRQGRRVRWELTGHGTALLREGTERIYGFMRERLAWDGRWLVLLLTVPETQRQVRHRLRTRLTWLGLGSPAPGVWVSPDATKVEMVRELLDELGLDKQAFAWVGPAAGIGDEGRVLSQAWRLGDVEDRYLAFLASFETRAVAAGSEAFRAQVDLVQAWRRFPFLDPGLPAKLLDHDWPGPRAAAAFHDRHARWHRPAQAEWDRMARARSS
jgi:phenylacetic acid degradation operon negative regulatory protein